MLVREPGSALARLRFDAAGLDHLIGLWENLADAAESGWTSRSDHHDRLLGLLGHPAGSDPQGLEVARTSLALLAAADPDAAATLRAFCLGQAAEIRRERSGFWDPSVLRRRSIDLACAPTSKEAQLLHRYERAHEESLRAAIRLLLTLERSGADLPEPPEAAPEAEAEAVAAPAAPDDPDANPGSQATCAELASVGAAGPSGSRAGGSAGLLGRHDGPIGADPGPGTGPEPVLRFTDLDG